MNTYSTSEIAKIIGIHPNTVRLYEQWDLIPEAERKKNGYRIFTDLHIDQFQLARTALKVEMVQNGLRKKAVSIIKTSAKKEFARAIQMTDEYLSQIQKEQNHAEEAIEIVKNLIIKSKNTNSVSFKRKEVSEYLKISMDTLRNWELNGLLAIKRKKNGYRVYTEDDITRLKIIRSLRCANYSLSSILRMLNALSENPSADIKEVIDIPKDDDDIISACDKLITSLNAAEENAKWIRALLVEMEQKYGLSI